MSRQIINLVNLSKYTNGAPATFLDTIESVGATLRELGIETTYSTNTIYKNTLNIIWGVGSFFSPSYAELKTNLDVNNCVIFNMEQIGSSSTLVNAEYLEFIARYHLFDYSQMNLEILQRKHAIVGYEFPLVPAKSFASDYDFGGDGKIYQFAFYGSPEPRREKILEELQAAGVKIKRIIGKYGHDLATEITDCVAVLNIHAYDASNIFEIARCLRPVAMGIPVISEISTLPTNIDWRKSGVIFEKYENISRLFNDKVALGQRLLAGVQEGVRFVNQKAHLSIARELIDRLYRDLATRT